MGISDVTIWQMKDPWPILFFLLYHSWQEKKMTAFQNKISEKVLWFSFWRTGWDRLAHLIEGQQSEQGTWRSLSVLDATVWELPRQLSLSSRGTRGTLVHVWAGKRILNSSGLSGVEEGWVKDSVVWRRGGWRTGHCRCEKDKVWQGNGCPQRLKEDQVKTLASLLQRMKGLAS